MTPPEPQPDSETTTSEPEPKVEDTTASPPTPRYGATIKLIQSRLADAERTKSKPWWKLK